MGVQDQPGAVRSMGRAEAMPDNTDSDVSRLGWWRTWVWWIAILMIVFGVLGIVIVCARAWVALMFGIALIYFMARIAWGFWHA
jgi:hypothetical protein